LDANQYKLKSFELADIQTVETAETGEFVKLKYLKDGVVKSFPILLKEYADRSNLVDALALAMGPNAKKSQERLSIPMSIIGPGITALGAIVVTGIFLMALADPEGGENYEGTGKGAGMKRLMASLLLKVGPGGVIGIGAIVLAGALFWMYRRIKNPPIKTVLSRN
jgi:hypothetical protein